MRTRFHDEEGVVAIVTAILLVVLIGSAAMAIDLGSMRTTRRTTANAADSVSLGIANYLLRDAEADGRCNYATAWSLAQALLAEAELEGEELEHLTIDYDGAGFLEGDLATDAGLQTTTNAACDVVGRVRAELTAESDLFFATVFGRSVSVIEGQTTSQFGYGLGSARLPTSVCARDEPISSAINALDGGGTSVYPALTLPPARINFASQSAMQCGSVAGNLGFIDCEQPDNGNGNAKTTEIVEWIVTGCPNVDVDDVPAPPDLNDGDPMIVYAADEPLPVLADNVCGTSPSIPAWCDVSSRNSTGNQINDALLSLVGEERTIIVIDHAHCANQKLLFDACPGPGNANVRPVGILTIEVVQICTSGDAYSLNADDSCSSEQAELCESPPGDLEIVLSGTCTSPSTSYNLGNNGFTMFVRFLKYSQATGTTGRSDGTLAPLKTEMCASERADTCSYDAL